MIHVIQSSCISVSTQVREAIEVKRFKRFVGSVKKSPKCWISTKSFQVAPKQIKMHLIWFSGRKRRLALLEAVLTGRNGPGRARTAANRHCFNSLAGLAILIHVYHGDTPDLQQPSGRKFGTFSTPAYRHKRIDGPSDAPLACRTAAGPIGPDLDCTLRDRRTRCSVFAVLPLSARLCDVWHDSHRLFCTQAIVDDHLSTFARNVQLSC